MQNNKLLEIRPSSDRKGRGVFAVSEETAGRESSPLFVENEVLFTERPVDSEQLNFSRYVLFIFGCPFLVAVFSCSFSAALSPFDFW